MRVLPKIDLDDVVEEVCDDIDTAFRRHSRYVAAVALRLLGRDSEIDDVVQDVFLAAMKGLRQLRDPQAARGWLATVTVRIARRRLRVRRLVTLIGLDEVHDYRALIVPGSRVEDSVLLSRVYRVLDRVPANHRIAWTLRYVNGDDLDTVAERCGCSLATAKRWIGSTHGIIQAEVDDG